MPGRTLVFVVTEDWFFASHFLPMLRAARRAGLETVVVTRVRHHGAEIEAEGARLVPIEADRRRLDPFEVLGTIFDLARILKREKADLVHCIALRSIVTGGAAAALAGVGARIFAVTGGGYLTARTDRIGRLTFRAVTFLVGRVLANARTRFIFENHDDPARFGHRAGRANVLVVGGAGVDPDHYRPQPLQQTGTIRVALVSRMLWSKGVDLAAEAVRQARSLGHDIELALYGTPDSANPKSIPLETLRSWDGRDGIVWHGRSDDVRAVWAVNDVACLPSRGGEGLPRSLLEAAACGRAMVTTDVPGCREFVRDGIDGFVVPPDDVAALRDALIRLSDERPLLAHMQASARQRVLQGFTEEAVSRDVEMFYRTLMP